MAVGLRCRRHYKFRYVFVTEEEGLRSRPCEVPQFLSVVRYPTRSPCHGMAAFGPCGSQTSCHRQTVHESTSTNLLWR